MHGQHLYGNLAFVAAMLTSPVVWCVEVRRDSPKPSLSIWDGLGGRDIYLDSASKLEDVTMELHLNQNASKPGEKLGLMLIFPGGGYWHKLTGPKDIDPFRPVALWANSMGFHAAILKYRVRRPWPEPLVDARRAVQFVRSHAEAWGVDSNRVCIMGFSAGGHVGSMLSTTWNLQDYREFDNRLFTLGDAVSSFSARPNLAVLSFPVITASQEHLNRSITRGHDSGSYGPGHAIGDRLPIAHYGSFLNILGKPPYSEYDVQRVSAEAHVTKDTPPTFIWANEGDHTVPVENTKRYEAALAAAGVSHEAHIFPNGAHGLLLASQCSNPEFNCEGTEKWPEMCNIWLGSVGWLPSRPKT